MASRRERGSSDGRGLTIDWPAELPDRGAHFFMDQIRSALESNGVVVEPNRPIAQEAVPRVVRVTAHRHGGAVTIAFDLDDEAEVTSDLADRAAVYFKLQYHADGYERPSIVPGGYVPANIEIYRYLPVLRAIRRAKRFRFDVYGRFGLLWGSAELRRRAYDLLAARTDFRFEGSLFRYPGGPDKIPYRRYLFEIPRAKVCVALPGLGDFTYRLVDYLAVGSCIVSTPLSTRFPEPLVEGEHIVYCRSDLEDLGDVCSQLVRDDSERERLAKNARDLFDRTLHRRRLGAYYARTIAAAMDGTRH